MKKRLLGILICGILVITGCGNKITNDRLIDYDNKIYLSDEELRELDEVNNKIIEYFTLNDVLDYDNFCGNYVDELNGVVVVELLNNSEEEQKKFKMLVVDSDLIGFKTVEEINLNDGQL